MSGDTCSLKPVKRTRKASAEVTLRPAESVLYAEVWNLPRYRLAATSLTEALAEIEARKELRQTMRIVRITREELWQKS